MPTVESNPAAVLAFDAAVIRAQSPRPGDKPLPPSTPDSNTDAEPTRSATLACPQGDAA